MTDDLSARVAACVAEQERAAARDSLIRFAQYVDPLAAHWYAARHLAQIAQVLERVERGELKRVIIAVPPRHWKSSLASEKFSAWWLGRNPKAAIIVASYALSLAEKFSKSAREVIGGDKFRLVFPGVRIARDSNRADDWMLEGGYRTSFRAVGTGGGISGHGARLILLDDVSDPNTTSSRTQTESDWTWYKNVIRTRLEANGAIVVINNRVGVNDLVGYLLDRERNDSADPPQDWTYIEIPARNANGSYLWEERFGREYYQKFELDTTLWRVQYEQRPTIASGAEFRRDWFRFVDRLPDGVRWQVRPWDLALTAQQTEHSDPDWTASCVGAVDALGNLYLGKPLLLRANSADVKREIEFAFRDEVGVRHGVGGALHEKALRDVLLAEGIYLDALDEKGDKTARIRSVVLPVASALRVFLVGTPSVWDRWLDQVVMFPAGHDDALDAMEKVIRMLGMAIQPCVLRQEQPAPSPYGAWIGA